MSEGKEVLSYANSEHIIEDMKQIIETARKCAYQSVNVLLVQRNWLLGKRIAEEVKGGEDRAEYGAKVISKLSKELMGLYGKGFTKTNLYSFIGSKTISRRFFTQ